jgi:hypothetical protein
MAHEAGHGSARALGGLICVLSALVTVVVALLVFGLVTD